MRKSSGIEVNRLSGIEDKEFLEFMNACRSEILKGPGSSKTAAQVASFVLDFVADYFGTTRAYVRTNIRVLNDSAGMPRYQNILLSRIWPCCVR